MEAAKNSATNVFEQDLSCQQDTTLKSHRLQPPRTPNLHNISKTDEKHQESSAKTDLPHDKSLISN